MLLLSLKTASVAFLEQDTGTLCTYSTYIEVCVYVFFNRKKTPLYRPCLVVCCSEVWGEFPNFWPSLSRLRGIQGGGGRPADKTLTWLGVHNAQQLRGIKRLVRYCLRGGLPPSPGPLPFLSRRRTRRYLRIWWQLVCDKPDLSPTGYFFHAQHAWPLRPASVSRNERLEAVVVGFLQALLLFLCRCRCFRRYPLLVAIAVNHCGRCYRC